MYLIQTSGLGGLRHNRQLERDLLVFLKKYSIFPLVLSSHGPSSGVSQTRFFTTFYVINTSNSLADERGLPVRPNDSQHRRGRMRHSGAQIRGHFPHPGGAADRHHRHLLGGSTWIKWFGIWVRDEANLWDVNKIHNY
jgi:hypothetical protein